MRDTDLDIRSLNLNYELMLRCADETAATEARKIFAGVLKHSRKIELDAWRKSQTFWFDLKNLWARFLGSRIVPFVALR